jgi:monoamine oxidase
MDRTDFGETIRQVGGFSAAAEYFTGNKNDEMDFRVKGGNIKVIEGLEKEINDKGGLIRLKSEVKHVRQDHNGVYVKVSGLPPYEASFCICTVPARTLTQIIFEPRLPDDQWDAAKQLQYARIMKTVVLFHQRTESRKPRVSGMASVQECERLGHLHRDEPAQERCRNQD